MCDCCIKIKKHFELVSGGGAMYVSFQAACLPTNQCSPACPKLSASLEPFVNSCNNLNC